MGTPLEDVEFLVRSQYRVRVLELLTEGPRRRSTIHRTTGISQPTLGRILRDFESRQWATREDGRYRSTPLGRAIFADLSSLLETVESMRRVQRVVRWFPADEFPFAPRRLADARVTVAGVEDIAAPVRRAADLSRTADRIRLVASAVVSVVVEAHWRAVVREQQRFEAVLATRAVDAIEADPELCRWLHDLLESERAAVFRYEGEAPHFMGVADDRIACIYVVDDEQTPRAFVETDDEVVREWVDSTVRDYGADATRLDADDLDCSA